MTQSPRPLPLQDKAVFLSGASQGLGVWLARALFENGARIMLAARNVENLRKVAAELSVDPDRVQTVAMDATDSASVENAVAATVTAFGRLDIAVNNAGIQIRRAPLAEIEDHEFDELMKVNMRGVFVAMKHEIRAMLKTDGGVIVNVASNSGIVGFPVIGAYTASKHGVIGLTKSAALDYATRGIRINAIAPGATMAGMFERGPASNPQMLAGMVARIPMKRIAQPEEVANAMIWLCSDAASYITGMVLPIDGGYVTA